MSKKSLLFFTENSITNKEIEAENYVISKIGYFFKDVHERRCKVILESDLNINLKDSFLIISKEEASALIDEKKNPNDIINYLKKENEELKKKLKDLKEVK